MHRAKHFPQVLCTRKKHLSSVNGSHNRFVLLLHLPPHLHPPLLVFLQSTKCAHPEICKILILPQGMHLKKLSKVRLSVYHVVNGQTARKRRCGKRTNEIASSKVRLSFYHVVNGQTARKRRCGKRTNEIACPAKGNCKAPDLKSRARISSRAVPFFSIPFSNRILIPTSIWLRNLT